MRHVKIKFISLNIQKNKFFQSNFCINTHALLVEHILLISADVLLLPMCFRICSDLFKLRPFLTRTNARKVLFIRSKLYKYLIR